MHIFNLRPNVPGTHISDWRILQFGIKANSVTSQIFLSLLTNQFLVTVAMKNEFCTDSNLASLSWILFPIALRLN